MTKLLGLLLRKRAVSILLLLVPYFRSPLLFLQERFCYNNSDESSHHRLYYDFAPSLKGED